MTIGELATPDSSLTQVANDCHSGRIIRIEGTNIRGQILEKAKLTVSNRMDKTSRSHHFWLIIASEQISQGRHYSHKLVVMRSGSFPLFFADFQMKMNGWDDVSQ